MEDAPRRAFLRQLASLPLLGGSVALLGQPTAVAEPATPDMLEAHKTWLEMEARFLSWDMAADPVFVDRYRNCFKEGDDRRRRADAISRHLNFLGDSGRYHCPSKASPYTRAALVLSAVGCDWREDEDRELPFGRV